MFTCQRTFSPELRLGINTLTASAQLKPAWLTDRSLKYDKPRAVPYFVWRKLKSRGNATEYILHKAPENRNIGLLGMIVFMKHARNVWGIITELYKCKKTYFTRLVSLAFANAKINWFYFLYDNTKIKQTNWKYATCWYNVTRKCRRWSRSNYFFVNRRSHV